VTALLRKLRQIILIGLLKLGKRLSEDQNWRTLAEFSLASTTGNEREAMRQVGQAVQSLSLPDSLLDRLKTAVAEATMNAIEHGNGLHAQHRVQIIALAENSALTLKIIDQGLQPLPSLNLARQERTDHRGWGLFLVKSLVDEVKAVVTPGRNELQLLMTVVEGELISYVYYQ
jgi:anti-sigma regulatory factor (Ser/Thr protein kinase)